MIESRPPDRSESPEGPLSLTQAMGSVPWVTAVLELVQAAGRAALEIYRQETKPSGQSEPRARFQSKSDGSPVTQADLASHRVLSEGLSRLSPAWPVVSEEDPASWCHRLSSGTFWLIDPLDGTREFLNRNGEFTINAALIHEGRALFGVVGHPVNDALYWGGPAWGAWSRVSSSPVASLRCTREPAVASSCEQTIRVVVSRSHLNADTAGFLERLARHGQVQAIQAGSSLKFCAVAAGQADLYPRLGPTHEWDTAAAQAVLEGAGGVVIDTQGHPLRYGKPESLNPGFIAASSAAWVNTDLLEALKQGQRSLR